MPELPPSVPGARHALVRAVDEIGAVLAAAFDAGSTSVPFPGEVSAPSRDAKNEDEWWSG